MKISDKTPGDFLGMTLREISDYLENMDYDYICIDGMNRYDERMRLSVSLKPLKEK